MRTQIIDTNNIEDHAKAIKSMVDVSLQDPEARKLAVAVASGSYDWIEDPKTKEPIPVIGFHGRYYRVSAKGTPPICEARDHTCEIVSVWNFVVLNVRYTGDTDGYDVYQDLRTTLEAGGGDCDDFTIAFCTLLRTLGYPCAARIISTDGQFWQHVYPMVEHPDDGWVALDATESGKKPGWEYSPIVENVDYYMGDG